MILETWGEVFTRAFQDISAGIIAYTPRLFFALFIFVLGWIVGAILGKVIEQFIKTIKVDKALREAGFEEIVSKAGFSLHSGRFLGGLVKWFVIIIFLVPTLQVLDLTQVNDFLLTEVLTYLPNVIAAVLILLVAAVIAEFMQSIVTGSAKAADISSARFLGTVAKWAIWIFAILAALGQLDVATAFVETLFQGIVIALALGFGLSFGLGGQEAASRYIEHLRKDMPHHEEEEKKKPKNRKEYDD